MTETWTIPCVEHVPDAEELEQLFQDLGNNKIPTLQWKNPGRRPISEQTPDNSGSAPQPSTPTQSPRNTNDSYDFFDESPSSDVRIRKPVTPKSSAKKKTANFESVLDSFKKQGRMPVPKDPSSM